MKDLKLKSGPLGFSNRIMDQAGRSVGLIFGINNGGRYPKGSDGAAKHADGMLIKKRIVACVNACEGLEDPSVVKVLVKMIHRIHDEIGCNLDDQTQDTCDECAILDRIEGKRDRRKS